MTKTIKLSSYCAVCGRTEGTHVSDGSCSQKDADLTDDARKAFEKWVVAHNQAEIKWIGHSYANAYMAAQWEGFKAAYNRFPDYDDAQVNQAFMAFNAVLDMGNETTVDGENVVIVPVPEYKSLMDAEPVISAALRAYVLRTTPSNAVDNTAVSEVEIKRIVLTDLKECGEVFKKYYDDKWPKDKFSETCAVAFSVWQAAWNTRKFAANVISVREGE